MKRKKQDVNGWHVGGRTQMCSVGLFTWMLYLLCVISASAQLSNGIYALFETSMGSFTARLDYVKVPMTAANFIGLAEGTRTWYGDGEGVPRNEPFYNGTIVNRIAVLDTNGTRIVQSGSRNGTNSGGGPGYTFRDEFDDSLRHDRPGTLSMANSGKNSNGSQYFFSLGPLPHLDDVHTVFGEVISGLDVLTVISEVPLTNSKPVTNVVFEQINILRVGEDAEQFDINAYGLPMVTSLPVRIYPADSNDAIRLDYPVRTNSQFVFSTSSALQDWSIDQAVWNTDIPVSTARCYSVTSSVACYAATRVDYSDQLFVPDTAHGYRIADTTGFYDFYLDETASTGMAYFSSGSVTGNIQYWVWTPDAYRSQLLAVFNNITPPICSLILCFTNGGVNSYDGTMKNDWQQPGASFSGDFTCERFTP